MIPSSLGATRVMPSGTLTMGVEANMPNATDPPTAATPAAFRAILISLWPVSWSCVGLRNDVVNLRG